MNAVKALELCKVRGYIQRQSDPKIKLWKNTVGAKATAEKLPGNDWKHHDPIDEAEPYHMPG